MELEIQKGKLDQEDKDRRIDLREIMAYLAKCLLDTNAHFAHGTVELYCLVSCAPRIGAKMFCKTPFAGSP